MIPEEQLRAMVRLYYQRTGRLDLDKMFHLSDVECGTCLDESHKIYFNEQKASAWTYDFDGSGTTYKPYHGEH